MASVHGEIEGRLRTAGYPTAHAKAIIAIAKAAKSCELAKRWWTMELALVSRMNVEVLWENVWRLAVKYGADFMVPEEMKGAHESHERQEKMEGVLI